MSLYQAVLYINPILACIASQYAQLYLMVPNILSKVKYE